FYGISTPDYVGWLIVGYLAGVGASSFRTLRAQGIYWPYLSSVVDWTAVAEHQDRSSAERDG
ncbi:MAG: hypothetical protein AAF989_06105, partial [Planctomycetota bacterium]